MSLHHLYSDLRENKFLTSLKSVSSGVNRENTNINIIKLGELEKIVLDKIINSTLRRFSPKDLSKDLDVSNKKIHDVLMQLVHKGFLRKIARGLYEVIPDAIQRYLRSTVKIVQRRRSKKVNREMNQSPPGTSPPDRGLNMFAGYVDRYYNVDGGFGSVFLFLDNVRGVGVGGVYVFGDRKGVLSPWLVSRVMSRVDYAEFGLFIGDSSVYLPGVIAVYPAYIINKGYGLKFEFRPYSWFNRSVLRRDGNSVNISLGFRYLWRILLSVFLVLGRVLLSDAPLEIRRIILSWIRRRCGCS
ncbi:MAG: hypothetical protein C0179_07165 [Fervidicoccus sp.]|nr:MAG: hypothetical protein C0179_07165 [Fervidicoccus sp.]